MESPAAQNRRALEDAENERLWNNPENIEDAYNDYYKHGSHSQMLNELDLYHPQNLHQMNGDHAGQSFTYNFTQCNNSFSGGSNMPGTFAVQPPAQLYNVAPSIYENTTGHEIEPCGPQNPSMQISPDFHHPQPHHIVMPGNMMRYPIQPSHVGMPEKTTGHEIDPYAYRRQDPGMQRTPDVYDPQKTQYYVGSPGNTMGYPPPHYGMPGDMQGPQNDPMKTFYSAAPPAYYPPPQNTGLITYAHPRPSWGSYPPPQNTGLITYAHPRASWDFHPPPQNIGPSPSPQSPYHPGGPVKMGLSPYSPVARVSPGPPAKALGLPYVAEDGKIMPGRGDTPRPN